MKKDVYIISTELLVRNPTIKRYLPRDVILLELTLVDHQFLNINPDKIALTDQQHLSAH